MGMASSRSDDSESDGRDEPDEPADRLVVHLPHDAQRARVEAFIDGIYARRFDARPGRFAPVLVSLRHGDDIVAAAGYRAAESGPLFLERYLDLPVESMLSVHAGHAPSREEIVEVGHLAAARAGEGQRLIRLLALHLHALGFQWAVGTLTRELRHLLLRNGVAPLALGSASPAALGAEASQWGRYYEHQPVVVAGHLRLALRHLARPDGGKAQP